MITSDITQALYLTYTDKTSSVVKLATFDVNMWGTTMLDKTDLFTTSSAQFAYNVDLYSSGGEEFIIFSGSEAANGFTYSLGTDFTTQIISCFPALTTTWTEITLYPTWINTTGSTSATDFMVDLSSSINVATSAETNTTV